MLTRPGQEGLYRGWDRKVYMGGDRRVIGKVYIGIKNIDHQ